MAASDSLPIDQQNTLDNQDKEEDSSLKGHSKELIDEEVDYVGDFAIKEGNLLLT